MQDRDNLVNLMKEEVKSQNARTWPINLLINPIIILLNLITNPPFSSREHKPFGGLDQNSKKTFLLPFISLRLALSFVLHTPTMLQTSQANALVYTTLVGFGFVGFYAGYRVKNKTDFLSGIRTQSGESI